MFSDKDLKKGFSLREDEISQIMHLENGVSIIGKTAKKKGKGIGGLLLLYPLQLVQVRQQASGDTVYKWMPIHGVEVDSIEIMWNGVTFRCDASPALKKLYQEVALLHYGVLPEALEREFARQASENKIELVSDEATKKPEQQFEETFGQEFDAPPYVAPEKLTERVNLLEKWLVATTAETEEHHKQAVDVAVAFLNTFEHLSTDPILEGEFEELVYSTLQEQLTHLMETAESVEQLNENVTSFQEFMHKVESVLAVPPPESLKFAVNTFVDTANQEEE